MQKKRLDESALRRYKMLLGYSIRDGQSPSDDSYYTGGKRLQLNEADEEPATGEMAQGYTKKGTQPGQQPDATATPAADAGQTPQSPADAMIPNMDGMEKPEGSEESGDVDMTGDPKNDVNGQGTPDADASESREDILSQLIQLHAQKLKELEQFAVDINERSRGYEAVVQTMPELQAKVGQLETQVEELTPPTPLQAMDKIVASSGGIKPEDYWNKFWREKNQNHHLDSSPYYPRQKGDGPPQQQGEQQNATYYLKPSDLPDLTQDQAQNSFKPRNNGQ